MEVPAIDKRRYTTILQLLADPITSFWGMLTKLEAWRRCRFLAEADKYSRPRRGPGKSIVTTPSREHTRNVAAIFGALEELVGFDTRPDTLFDLIIELSNKSPSEMEAIIARTAHEVSDSRTDERLRTLLAAFFYLFQVISAFVATVGGESSSPPGGRIGTAIFLTFILPAILLSNAMGGFTTRRTCFRIMDRFVCEMDPGSNLWELIKEKSPQFRKANNLEQYYNSQPWSGAIYTYRPNKTLAFQTGSRDRSPLTLLLLATLPILISSSTAFAIIYNTPPASMNCRTFWVLGITLAWFVSAFITWVTWKPAESASPGHKPSRYGCSGSLHWAFILTKDVLFAVPICLLIILSSCGLFNTCTCWSGLYSFGIAGTKVALNSTGYFLENGKHLYPMLVGICLGGQFLVFGIMMWSGWAGWRNMRWREKDRMEECNGSDEDVGEGLGTERVVAPPQNREKRMVVVRIQEGEDS